MLKTIKKILEELRKHIGKKKFYAIFICVATLSILSALEPLFFGKIISELEKYYETQFFDTKQIIQITIFWFIFIVISQIWKYIVFQEIITRPAIIDYRESIKKYCYHTISMTMKEYLGKKISSIYKLIDRGTDNKLFFILNFFDIYIFYLISISFIITILFFINVKMAFISLSLLPVMIYLGCYFTKITWPKQEYISKKWERIFEVVGNAMSSYSLFKILSLETNFLKNIYKRSDETYVEQMELNKAWNFSEIYAVLIIMLTRVIVLGFGIFFVKSSEITLAELFVIFSYIGFIYFPLSFVFNNLRDSVKQLTEVQRMYDELGDLEMENDLDSGEKLKKVTGNIKFENINFSYLEERQVIKNLNLEIKFGEKVALVGNTGSGKSTIVNLILRFWEADKGSIYLDGKDISEISKKSLRSHIGVVSQDNSLFNLSIKENLVFANPKANSKDIEEALKKAEANFVFEFPSGIDTIIGERGLKLSGGEKQRLSIARLFLKNPEILILDEATSALDNRTEKLVHKALDKLMERRTSIIIAHRLSTIQSVDKIFMLESGEIVESGNYKELMNKKGKFYELANPYHLIIN